MNNLVDIKYFDKKKKQGSFVLEKGKKYNAKVKRPTADDQYTRLVNLEGVNEFEILVKKPTETENVFLCDIIKIVNVGNERKEYPRENVYITILPSDGYQPLKKEPKQKSRFEK